jgi:CD109 antigen
LNYIEKSMDSLNDTYSLAITSYALQLVDHPMKSEVLDKLNRRSIEEDGLKYWSNDQTVSKPNSINTEMTAYALLAFLEAGRDIESLSIMKWLIAQRNENGGFQSTQDTVVGLQALAKMAGKLNATNLSVELSAEYENGKSVINVCKDNMLVLQKHELPKTVRNVNLKAQGQGLILAQLSYKFNVETTESNPRFSIETTQLDEANSNLIQLKVCAKFIPDASTSQSNMAIMEISFPSGFSYDSDSTEKLLAIAKIKVILKSHQIFQFFVIALFLIAENRNQK